MNPLIEDLSHILVTEKQIESRTKFLGRDISEFYRKRNIDEITAICITNGSIIFSADLLRKVYLHVKMDCIRVSSYRDETSPVTNPEIIDHIRLDIEGQHVLLIDDVLDTGKTINRITSLLRRQNPSSFHSCVLLDKKGRRKDPYEADFVGFKIPDEFVVGYGLDFAERYRNLPCIGVLKPELQNPPEWQ